MEIILDQYGVSLFDAARGRHDLDLDAVVVRRYPLSVIR